METTAILALVLGTVAVFSAPLLVWSAMTGRARSRGGH
jgi:hypothetical protein